MLAYIYTEEVNNLYVLAVELAVAADKYQIEHLKLICEQKVLSVISVENCIDLLKLSGIHSLKHLEQKLIPLIKENSNKIHVSIIENLSKSHPHLMFKLYKEIAYKK